jgi:hypothetical protein
MKGGRLVNGTDSKTDKASATDARQAPLPSWDDIPWERVEAHVSKLQTRIARATRDGRVEEARRAQRMLVASFDAKLLAVRTVTTNKGKNTPGVDGELWSTPPTDCLKINFELVLQWFRPVFSRAGGFACRSSFGRRFR